VCVDSVRFIVRDRRLESVSNARGAFANPRLFSTTTGRKFFEEVDRSGKEKLTLEDLKVAMKKRNLPPTYAKAFMDKAKGNKIFARTITWDDFKSVMNERESTMLRTYNSMTMSRSGMLKMSDVKGALGRLGLAATDENAAAMLKHLRGSAEYSRQGYVTYGQFRNFLMLLPPEVANATDPSRLWYEAATIVQFSPPQKSGNFKLACKAALAGGLASATTTSMMHPLDTLKTRLQAAVGKGPSLLDLIKSVPKLGPRKMYQGIIPAVTGSFAGHGLRTATFEVVCKVLAPAVALPFVTETAIQGVGSGVGTLLGTCVRIPCEVLKQRLQTDQYSNVILAFKGITADTPRALFAGTAATLTREIPFYVTGLMIYQNLKKGAVAINGGRELENYQIIMVGACAGALGSVMVNPFDVMKTRTMTGSVPYGQSLWVSMAHVVKTEGALALMKGAIPRMAWIAPLGAMNFSGYELAKKAMMKDELEASKELMNVPAVRARPPDIGDDDDER
jgi:Ca2+-binding EF-hand superfamily protein